MQHPSGRTGSMSGAESAAARARERLARRAARGGTAARPADLTRLRALEDAALRRYRHSPAYRADLALLCARLFAALRLAAGGRCTGASVPAGPLICACCPRPLTAAVLNLCDAVLRAGGTVGAALERRRGAAAVLLHGSGSPPARLIRSAACAARAAGAWVAVRQGRELRLTLILPLLPADGLPESPLPTVRELLYGSVSPLRVRLPQLFAADSGGPVPPK